MGQVLGLCSLNHHQFHGHFMGEKRTWSNVSEKSSIRGSYTDRFLGCRTPLGFSCPGVCKVPARGFRTGGASQTRGVAEHLGIRALHRTLSGEAGWGCSSSLFPVVPVPRVVQVHPRESWETPTDYASASRPFGPRIPWIMASHAACSLAGVLTPALTTALL